MALPADALPPLKEIVKHYGLAAHKSLGQNFLFDMNLTDKIARAAGDLTQGTVIEVGPGPGGLTRSLLKAGAHVVAIEKDTRCIAALNDYLVPASQGRLTVLDQDAMTYEGYTALPKPLRIVANLPYNISTQLLFGWLERAGVFASLTLMFQKEVGMRIKAEPNSKDYGRLSIKTQWLCDIHHDFDIPPTAFFPPPKVTSSVLTFTPRAKPLFPADSEVLDRLCLAVFNQRRKTLRVSLKQMTSDPVAVLTKAGIDDNRRPESLSIEEFCALAQALA